MQICTAHSVRPWGYFSFRLGPAHTRPGPVSLAARPETRQALFARGDNLCYLMLAKQRTESRNRSIARARAPLLQCLRQNRWLAAVCWLPRMWVRGGQGEIVDGMPWGLNYWLLYRLGKKNGLWPLRDSTAGLRFSNPHSTIAPSTIVRVCLCECVCV